MLGIKKDTVPSHKRKWRFVQSKQHKASIIKVQVMCWTHLNPSSKFMWRNGFPAGSWSFLKSRNSIGAPTDVIKNFTPYRIIFKVKIFRAFLDKLMNLSTWHPLESLVTISVQATEPIVSSVLHHNLYLGCRHLTKYWCLSSPWGWSRWGRTWWSCSRQRPAHQPGNLQP